ncbi:hypothetical protein OIE13_06495 [Streptosporangium sp. NBC_01810]|uniref:hypothetical protein n=1 Tax=Streptosporangium sp. NBC_01810 TaxID=2975951 RepID=UPI002DD9B775|nr:hypothetical protein [Streptosporangium sp. NBC_01810]WSA27518.1 hypothetical protein OIE13_06495 [Streptosporangium sp. NBC_01810]
MGAAALVVGVLAVSGVWSSGETASGGGVVRVPAPGGPAAEGPPGDPAAGAVVAAELDGKSKEDAEEAAKRSKTEKKSRKVGEAEASGPSKHTDKKALAYFESRKVTKRVRDIRMVGGYLRIYTDLPESADNSKQAIKLCEAGVDYLVGELGVPDPVVFVQAEFGENGNPVLANVLGPDDSDCRVTYPEPRR